MRKKKYFYGFPLQYARVSVKPSKQKKALLIVSEQRDQMKNRRPERQTIIKTLWEHRWCETALRCLMCGWVMATSWAGFTQPISRRDTSASLQRWPTISMNNCREASPDHSYIFPPVSLSCQSSDGRMCIVATWCHCKLSCSDMLESIFTLIWVALLGSHLTTIHLIKDLFECDNGSEEIHGNLLGLAVHLGKYWSLHVNTFRTVKYYPDSVLSGRREKNCIQLSTAK